MPHGHGQGHFLDVVKRHGHRVVAAGKRKGG